MRKFSQVVSVEFENMNREKSVYHDILLHVYNWIVSRSILKVLACMLDKKVLRYKEFLTNKNLGSGLARTLVRLGVKVNYHTNQSLLEHYKK